jgi:hypothetical protein
MFENFNDWAISSENTVHYIPYFTRRCIMSKTLQKRLLESDYRACNTYKGYHVDSSGNLLGVNGRRLKPNLAARGSIHYSINTELYGRVNAYDRVIDTFILGRPSNSLDIVRFLDGDLSNYRLDNLEVIPNYYTEENGWLKHPELVNIRVNEDLGIYSLHTRKILSPEVSDSGYLRVTVDGTHYLLHRLIYSAYSGKTINYRLDNFVVDHIDNDIYNNKYSNLQLLTNEGNTSKYFSEHHDSSKIYRFTQEDINLIIEASTEYGMSNKEIYEAFFIDKVRFSSRIRYITRNFK